MNAAILRRKLIMTKISKPDYLAKVKLLTKEETERLLSRMGGKLDRRLEKHKVSQEEALAMQLKLEDEQLQEWRKMMHSLKKKEEAKKEAKAKVAKKAKAPLKAKIPLKAKVA
jgi:N-acyl-L-homoserine lactone synthetase